MASSPAPAVADQPIPAHHVDHARAPPGLTLSGCEEDLATVSAAVTAAVAALDGAERDALRASLTQGKVAAVSSLAAVMATSGQNDTMTPPFRTAPHVLRLHHGRF